MKYENVTIGGDFEYFLADRTGRPFPSCGLIGGSKEQPREMGEPGYLITEDNVMVEYNIPPVKTADDFAKVVTHGFDLTCNFLPPSLVPVIKATMEFDPVILTSIPQAMQFGCMPDFNAWDVTKNPRPNSNVNFRSAAGHIHIGYDNPNVDASVDLIRAADVFAGLPSVWEDEDRTRRTLYGKAGACRFKEYGCEHRVLGNYWIGSRKTAKAIFNRYQQAIKFLNDGGKIEEADFKLIQQAINTYDVELAKQLHNKYAGESASNDIPEEIQNMLDNAYNTDGWIKHCKRFIKPGKTGEDFTENYQIKLKWDGNIWSLVSYEERV